MENNRSANDRVGIVALGNILGCNDEFGSTLNFLRCILPSEIELINAGSSGMPLLGFLENKTRLIVLEADYSHQLGLAEVLYWTHSIGTIPKEIVVIDVEEQLPLMVHKVLDCLKEWGVIQEEQSILLN